MLLKYTYNCSTLYLHTNTYTICELSDRKIITFRIISTNKTNTFDVPGQIILLKSSNTNYISSTLFNENFSAATIISFSAHLLNENRFHLSFHLSNCQIGERSLIWEFSCNVMLNHFIRKPEVLV